MALALPNFRLARSYYAHRLPPDVLLRGSALEIAGVLRIRIMQVLSILSLLNSPDIALSHPTKTLLNTRIVWLLAVFLAALCLPLAALGQGAEKDICPRPRSGSMLSEPEDLRSENGVLKVELTYTNFRDASGQMHYCYRDKNGSQAPNLRLHPGDWLVLTLKNNLQSATSSSPSQTHAPEMHKTHAQANGNASCGSGMMDGLSTNLHFHGLSVPPVCHQDDVLHTLISPSDPPFEYRLQIPPDETPGVYWYHPHVHGSNNVQVQGGASGALIVEGIERANPLVAGLPERVLIVRDQDLIHPNAVPAASMVMPQMPPLRDPDGDILNMGGVGMPSKDLSINFVAVPYPDYPPALVLMRPSERQLWRLLNASAITYLDLRVLFNGVPQSLGQVSVDGVPVKPVLIKQPAGNIPANQTGVIWQNHLELPPGARADVIVTGPPDGVYGNLVTEAVDTGPAGENDPIRPLLNIISKAGVAEPRSTLSVSSAPALPKAPAWLGTVKPVRERKLYFSERPSDSNNPNSRTVFMMTIEGQPPVPFDPAAKLPNLIVSNGDVEDWTIENRSQELHAFHIHQLHFLLLQSNGVPVDEPFLRDIVNVNYWDGKSSTYPSVKLRMDFRNPRIVGTFAYHCHLLEHEDGGMMGTIQVTASRDSK
jgi:FtsP/CotA-like multicopper oxidase with cupredoxin domain